MGMIILTIRVRAFACARLFVVCLFASVNLSVSSRCMRACTLVCMHICFFSDLYS